MHTPLGVVAQGPERHQRRAQGLGWLEEAIRSPIRPLALAWLRTAIVAVSRVLGAVAGCHEWETGASSSTGLVAGALETIAECPQV